MDFQNFIGQNIVIERNSSLRDSYRIGSKIGEGAYGVVRTVTHRATGERRAVKMIRKSSLQSRQDSETILNEITTLKSLNHPNIIRIYEFYEDKKFYYIITEYCSGGELFDRIISNGNFSEATAAKYMREILSVVAYCHERGVVHRDLKPENFLLDNEEPEASLKVIDFGCAKNAKGKMTERVGSVYYIAPEVIRKNYTEKCDVWSAGVNLYIMLCGYPPFNSDAETKTFRKIVSGHFSFHSPDWDDISFEAKDLITKMLTLDASQRLTARQALQHPWLSNASRTALNLNSGRETFNNLKNFRAEQRLQKAALAFIVSQLTTKQEREEMIEVFRTIDADNSGTLSRSELIEGYSLIYGGDDNCHEEVDSIMQQVDADQSGDIDYNEFIAATISKQVVFSRDRLRAAFSAFDVDRNGIITADELRLVLGGRKSDTVDWVHIIEEADRNGDGVIDLKEFTEMMLSMYQAS